jgi:hypothetical protein
MKRQIFQKLSSTAAAACFGCSCVFQPAIDLNQTRKSSCNLQNNLHANGRPNTVAIAKEEFVPRGDHTNENCLSEIKIQTRQIGRENVIRANHKRKK